MQTELLEVSVPADAGNALLLSAESLHRDDLEGYLYFELDFDGGDTITTYDPYNMDFIFFDDSVSTLAYIESFDGTQLVFDVVEWINIPSERAQELGIMDSGSGFTSIMNRTRLSSALWRKTASVLYSIGTKTDFLSPRPYRFPSFRAVSKSRHFPAPRII